MRAALGRRGSIGIMGLAPERDRDRGGGGNKVGAEAYPASGCVGGGVKGRRKRDAPAGDCDREVIVGCAANHAKTPGIVKAKCRGTVRAQTGYHLRYSFGNALGVNFQLVGSKRGGNADIIAPDFKPTRSGRPARHSRCWI